MTQKKNTSQQANKSIIYVHKYKVGGNYYNNNNNNVNHNNNDISIENDGILNDNAH